MKRFKNIVCVVQIDDAYLHALERAVALAQNNQASLTVVAVIGPVTVGMGMPEGGPVSLELQEAVVRSHQQQLENIINPYRERLELSSQILIGTPFLEIIRDVLRNKRDLVVTTPEPLDWFERLFSSDDMHLLRKCPCPVWFIKPDAPGTFRRILAAVDVGEDYPRTELKTRHALNVEILKMAFSLALSEFAEIHIVHAWELSGESAMRGVFLHTPEDKINTYIEQTRQQHAANMQSLVNEITGELGEEALSYLKPQIHLVKGRARKEIPQMAASLGVDLAVMGTVARTGIPGFIMGNTAETILNQINCSVLAIKPPGFVTPITLQE